MSCKCQDLTTTLRCTNCGTLVSISYNKTDNPVIVAKRNGIVCKNCNGNSFEVAV